MWVTAIDYCSVTDEYLGILLNAPHYLDTIQERDNAVFRYDPGSKRLRALALDGNYRSKGIPLRARSGVLSEVWDGIRQYRLGRYGHNQVAIDRCIAVLASATQLLSELESTHDRYLAYFVLGRCHAEAYNTDAAIEAFGEALRYDGSDVDAHMSLLAEYSLKVHPPKDLPKKAYDARWELLFLKKLEYVRENFPEDSKVQFITTVIFDESTVTNLSELSSEEIERGRRFGFGIFRWKR